MTQTTPIIAGGMNVLRLPAFFENVGHSNVILPAGGGAFKHKGGPAQGAVSCRQAETAWQLWKAGVYGDLSLSDGVIEHAKTLKGIKGSFLTFQQYADSIYPGWRQQLGYVNVGSSSRGGTLESAENRRKPNRPGQRARRARARANAAAAAVPAPGLHARPAC